jgi:hypothetical protein
MSMVLESQATDQRLQGLGRDPPFHVVIATPRLAAFPLPSQAELKRSAFRSQPAPLPSPALLNTTSSHTFPSAYRFDFLHHNVFTNCSRCHVFSSKLLYRAKAPVIPSPTALLFHYLGQTRNTGSLHIECFANTDSKGMMWNDLVAWTQLNLSVQWVVYYCLCSPTRRCSYQIRHRKVESTYFQDY